METHSPPLHIVNPRDGHTHTHTVIFLHGRDSTNQEFASEFFESEASEPADQPRTLRDLFPTVRWVFPGAPTLRSARFDTDMPQWFDMWSVEDPTEQAEIQHDGLRRSIKAILDVVKSEEAQLDAQGRRPGLQNIFLAGISQGFATAVAAFFAGATGNTQTRGLAGLIGLCSWMPLGGKEELLRVLSDAKTADGAAAIEPRDASSTPVLLCHSSNDDVVPVQNGRALRDILEQSQEVEWHEYVDGGHWVNEPQGVDDIASFLRRHM